MNKKTTSIFSYITLLCWLIAYYTGDREGAKFYLNQSLIIGLLTTIISILTKIFPHGVFNLILNILMLVACVFWIIGLVHACKQDDKRIPLIGNIELLK